MNEKNSIDIAFWMSKSKKLLNSIRDLFNKIGFDESLIYQDLYDEDKRISLVFAGQYSAGKSTIIKALTGIDDIAIGAEITTQNTHAYDWNGIEVIDTPGIHTVLRPDHDEISYQAIANADMLVYVVTDELFDDFIGQNFRKLLIEKDKASEMILVVNKMANIGNTVENQKIKLEDLEKVTKPYLPEQVRTVFVDAESYLDSFLESDVEIVEELRKRSNYDQLVLTLNNFICDKGILSQLTTVLYRQYDVLQKAIQKYQPSTGDNYIDALESHLQKERSIILNTKFRIEKNVKSLFEEAAFKIQEKGREIANSVYDYKNEEEANDSITRAYKYVDKITSDCVDSVTYQIEELSSDCQIQLDEFYKSDFSKMLKIQLNSKNNKSNPLIEKLFNSDILINGGSFIISNTVGANATANGLKEFTGSRVHKIVLNIGHFFNHNFKPWEAVKLTKGINIAGKAIGVFGVIFSIGMQAKDDIDANKRENEMRNFRESIRAEFNSAANEVIKYFNNALNNLIEDNYSVRINSIDLQIEEIRSMRLEESETCKLLESAQKDCKQLILDIHKSYDI